MTDMLVMCSKGCGFGLNATEEMQKEAQAAGVPLSVQHDVCPNEDVAPMRSYKMYVAVDELKPDGTTIPVAKMGHTVEAKTFTDGLPELQRNLNEQWSAIVGLASVIDSEYIETHKEESDTTSDGK
jgi:hypothetical protein